MSIFEATDLLVLICRGIEWCRDEKKWLPCGYIQQARRGTWPDGSEKRDRTGFRDSRLNDLGSKFAPESRDSWLAGTEINIKATVAVLRGSDVRPKMLVVSGGKPKYLEQWPGGAPSEGEVVHNSLPIRFMPARVGVNEAGKNTEDDVKNALDVAIASKYRTVTFVNVEVAMPRTIAFWGKVRAEHPEYQGIKVRFLVAEHVLDECLTVKSLDLFRRTFSWARSSNAWRFTWTQELIGLQKLVEGKYAAKGKY